MAVQEARCSRRLQFRLVDDVVEIHCRWCSADRGEPAMHRWRVVVGEGGEVELVRCDGDEKSPCARASSDSRPGPTAPGG